MDYDTDPPPRFRGISFAAGWAALITLLCVIVGQGAEQYAKLNGGPAPAAIAVAAKPQFGAIDYSATGSIKSPNGALSPCGPSK